jgi:hypothetical protein
LKLIAVAMVKNEEDIVEAFVRYHADMFDELLVLDHNSADRTLEILAKLQSEGLPLHVSWLKLPVYDQSSITRDLVLDAVQRFGAEAVVILDCDEFVISQTGELPRNVIEAALEKNDVLYLQWATYVVGAPSGSVGDDEYFSTSSILEVMLQRLLSEPVLVHKVVISARVIDDNLFLKPGNHDVAWMPQRIVSRIRLDCSVVLAHFPVRSALQARRKYLVGWLGMIARGTPPAFDWAVYHYLAREGAFSPEMVVRLAASYNEPSRKEAWTTTYAPVAPGRGATSFLRYNRVREHVPIIEVLSQAAEDLASHVANLEKAIETVAPAVRVSTNTFRKLFAPALAASSDTSVVSMSELFDLWQETNGSTSSNGKRVGYLEGLEVAYKMLLSEFAVKLSGTISTDVQLEPMFRCHMLVIGSSESEPADHFVERVVSAGWSGSIVVVGAFANFRNGGWGVVQRMLRESDGRWRARVRGKVVILEQSG